MQCAVGSVGGNDGNGAGNDGPMGAAADVAADPLAQDAAAARYTKEVMRSAEAQLNHLYGYTEPVGTVSRNVSE